MSEVPSRPRDQAARTRAATDFATNLVVSAGAGTGKTTLLVERVLCAIGSGTAPLAAIAAITFTDKAAGELRHRLATGLRRLGDLARGASAGDPSAASSAYAWLTGTCHADPATIAERAAEAEDALDRATVTTIHGFCAEILRAHPLASDLPPGFAVDRGLAGRRLAEEEWTPFLEGELGENGAREALWNRVLRTFNLTALEEIARALSTGAISAAALRQDLEAYDLKAAMGDDARRLVDDLRFAIDRTPGLTDAPREWLDAAERALRTFADAGGAAARQVIEDSPRLPGAMPGVRTKFVSDTDAAALEALEERALPLLRGLAVFDERVEADLYAVLLPFVRRLRARQTRAGLVDFEGLLVRARDLLRDARDVRATLKRRFRMILVDEFQDTDPIQYEIVFLLAERDGEHAPDAYKTHLAAGRLFIVGDAKQSIYRFRGADYTAYRNAVRHVLDQGGAELTLSSNFRSLPSVLGPVNALFAEPGSSLWCRSEFLPPYEPIDAERADDGAAAVDVWTTSSGTAALASARRRAEGQAMATELDAFAGPGRPWRYDDVLVLFRGFSELAPYLRALREANIPFVVSGGRRFFERTEIVQAMAVLRAVADPDDPVALLAYRRSPAGGVPDTELLAEARGEPASRPALAGADRRLEALRAEAARLPVDAAVRYVLDASGLLPLSGMAFEGAQRVANLEKLQLAASELARDGRRTLTETLDALQDGFESDEEGDSPLADSDRDAVRIMTIHKAKGLEARVVILADTAAGRTNQAARRYKARMARFASGEFVRLDGPRFKNGAEIAASADHAQHVEAEDVRLLYVALTRARDRLIVFGGGRGTAWSTALAEWKGGVTHRTVSEAGIARPAGDAPPPGAPGALALYEAATAAIESLSATAFQSPSGGDDAGAPESAIAGALDPELARAVGRIVHARLAGMTTRETGIEEREAGAILRAFAGSPLAARLSALTVLGREIPMLLAEAGARWSGAIDLLCRDRDGALVVVDFKTDSSDDGAIERHGAQLRVYARAVRRAMPGERVRAELWMLRTGRILEV